MLAVIAITGIIITLSFSILRLVQTHFHSLNRLYSVDGEINRFEVDLLSTMNSADRVFVNQDLNEIWFKNSLNESKLLLGDLIQIHDLDTFNLKINSINPYFLGEEVIYGELDALEIILSEPKGKTLFVAKRNTATSFMNVE